MATIAQLIVDVSANTVALNKGLGEIQSGLDRVSSYASKMSSMLGVAFSASAVISFGNALLDDADALMKLSDKTGVSLQGLQRFRIAGDDAGNTIDQLTTAISQMENRLSSGDASAIGALKKLQIAVEDIQNLSPENQFMAIAEAIGGIKDPSMQTQIAMDLFGKSGAEILPTLKRGFDDLKGAAVGMSDETIRAMDRLGDESSAFWRSFKGYAAEALIGLKDWADAGMSPLQKSFNDTRREAAAMNEELKRMGDHIKDPKGMLAMAEPFKALTSQGATVQKFNKDFEEAQRKIADAAKKAADEEKRLNETLKVMGSVLPGLHTSIGTTVNDLEHMVDASRALAKELDRVQGHSDPVVRGLYDIGRAVPNEEIMDSVRGFLFMGPLLDKTAGRADTATDSLGNLAQAFAQLAQISGDSFGGAVRGIGQLIGSVNLAQIAMKNLNAAVKDGKATWSDYATAAAGTIGAVATAFNVLSDWFSAGSREQESYIKKGHDAWAAFLKQFDTLENRTRLFSGDDFSPLEEEAAAAGVSLDRLRAALAAPASWQSANAIIAEIQRVQDAFDRFNLLSGEASSRFGPSRSELEATVKDAADVLAMMTANLITETNTQGQYTQDQLNQAYYAWQKAMADSGNEAAAAWVKTHDAVTSGAASVNAAFDALLSRRDALAKSVENEAPEEVMGVIESATRGQMAALDAQIENQRRDLERQGNEAADDLEAALGGVYAPPVHVPIIWDFPPLTPGGSGGGTGGSSGTGASFTRSFQSTAGGAISTRGLESKLDAVLRQLTRQSDTFPRAIARAVANAKATA